jgi:hypothetical protein
MLIIDNKLTSKIQYNTFEPGEFAEERKRNYEEIVTIIENFPWGKQREKLQIDLTNPSITIQDDILSYLKLSLYYNGKFVLYFFDGNSLYSKSLLHYNEAYNIIEAYMKTKSINFSEFKKQNVLFKPLKIHFISNEFIYKVDPDKPFKYVSAATIFPLALFLGLIVYFFIKTPFSNLNVVPFIFLLFVFPLLGGINLMLTINYFVYSKGKSLRLSKGSNIFQYGDIENPQTFNKSDINEIIIKQNTAIRCPWGDFTLSFIYMKDGSIIKIPNILLSGNSIQLKNPTIQTAIKNTYIPYWKLKEV